MRTVNIGPDAMKLRRQITRKTVQNQALVKALMRDVDRGEAESIALALESETNLILLDEQEGRHLANRLGLEINGIVGVLLEAKNQGIVENVRPHLNALRQRAGFYLDDSLYQTALNLANEIKS